MEKLNNIEDMFLEIEKILKSLKKDDLVCIISHDDADGSCSAALFSLLVQEIIGTYPLIFPIRGANNVNKKLLSSLKTLNPEMVVVLDMSVDPKKLNLFSGFVLDHHIFEIDDRQRSMLYFNPRFFEKDDEKVVPTSYMVYRIMQNMSPDKKVSWIAGIGITEDHRVFICQDVFDDIKKEYPELLRNNQITQDAIEKTVFAQMWDIVRAGRMVRGGEGAKTAVLALMETKHRPDQFVNGVSEYSYTLKKYYERMLDATQTLMKDLEVNGKFYKEKKVVVYEPKNIGLSGITSFLSDKIRQEYPEWISCVVSKSSLGGKAKISIRVEQTKRSTDLVQVLRNIQQKIPSISGGGHKSAVGLNINYRDFNRFLEEFLAAV